MSPETKEEVGPDLGGRFLSLKIQEQADILRMRKQWSRLLMGILIFEAVTTFGLVPLIGFHPEVGERLGKLIIETYIIKFVSEVLAMPLIVVKFLFDQKGTTPE